MSKDGIQRSAFSNQQIPTARLKADSSANPEMEGGVRMAISITDVKYAPDPLVAGKKVKATCKVTADEGIESVKIYSTGR